MTARVPGACAKFRVMPRNVSACMPSIYTLPHAGLQALHMAASCTVPCTGGMYILHVSTDHIILICMYSLIQYSGLYS